jgi:capsular exopolysaccharide synthesis family protein
MSEFFKALEQAERDRQRLAGYKESSAESVLRGRPVGGPATRAGSMPVRAAAQRTKRSLLSFRPFRANVPVLITQLEPDSIAAEAYRTVRTNLEFIRTDRPCRNVVVTSPTAGSGKSTTAANLAVAAAQSGRRVCLVDADVRRPMLHEVFGLPNTGGLINALRGGMPLETAARPTRIENLSLVVAGQNTAGAAQALFTSERLRRVMSEGGDQLDLVIYDTAPVLLVADSVNLAAMSDGVIIVVRWGSIPPRVLQRAVHQITQVNGRVLGVLLNQVNLRRDDDDVYRYYRTYYGEKPRK